MDTTKDAVFRALRIANYPGFSVMSSPLGRCTWGLTKMQPSCARSDNCWRIFYSMTLNWQRPFSPPTLIYKMQ